MLSRAAPAEPTAVTTAPPASGESAGSAPAAPIAEQEQWLTEIAREPEWSLQTSAAVAAVEPPPEQPIAAAKDVGHLEGKPLAGEPDASDRDAGEHAAGEPDAATEEPRALDPRSQELEEALAWGEEEAEPAAANVTGEARAEIDESGWPFLDQPVDEFGFPIAAEGYEQLFSGRHGAQPSAEGAAGQHAADPAGTGAPPERDPERIARVLQTLADQVREGALRLPGEVDRGDEAVVLAATLTALLSRNRE